MSDVMQAPPSSAFRIVDVPEVHDALIQSHGIKGSFIGPSEEESPWVPFGDNAAIRHLAFDVRQNIFCNVLWIKSPGVIGTHKHRGRLVMMCLAGSMRYLEHDWVAEEGSFAFEPPGETHTLFVPEDVEEMITWFHVQGGYTYVDPQGVAVGYEDVFTKLETARAHYKKLGLPDDYIEQFIR